MLTQRIVLYIKDVLLIAGQGERSARRLMKKIKEKNGGSATLFISVQEFCAYTGLAEENVKELLR